VIVAIPTRKEKVTLYAGYHQFHLKDEQASGSTGATDFWTAEAFNNMLAVNPGIVGVTTGSYGDVPVEIEVYESDPGTESDNWDHIVEAAIDLGSGNLLVCGCPDPEEVGRINLAPGAYRLRVCYGNLDSVIDEECQDHYVVRLWPDNFSKPEVLKRWKPQLQK
jgi:hypothetical protein